MIGINDHTKYREEDKHHDRTYYLLRKIDINHECPFGSSDHVVLEIDIKRDIEDKQEESYKKKSRNYSLANYTTTKFFNGTDRTKKKKKKKKKKRNKRKLKRNMISCQ